MINREYKNYKYFRTYLGNSKTNELQLLINVQGDSDDNCNWIDYYRMLNHFINDDLHVCYSRKELLKKILTIMIILSIFMTHNQTIFIIIIGIIITLLILLLYIKHKLNNKLKNYNMCLMISSNELFKQSGINITNN